MTIEITEPEDPSDPASHHKIIFTSDGGSFPYSGSDIVTGSNPHTPSAAVITGSLFLSGSGHITASGMVLAKEMVSSSVIRANTYMVNDDKVFAQFLQNFGSIEAGTIVLGDVTAPAPIFVNTTELTLAGTRGITSMNPITASTFGTNNVSISASGVISSSHLHLFTSGSTFDLENPELSTDPTLYVSGNAYISGYLDLDGPFDFSGFTFIQDVVAELTGSTSFGSTASLNGHTFTGSIVVSSSQTPAFSVVDGNQTNFSISPNGELSSSALISSSGNIEGLNIFASNDLTVGNDADITNGETNILQINFVGSPSEADPSGVTTGPSLFTHFE